MMNNQFSSKLKLVRFGPIMYIMFSNRDNDLTCVVQGLIVFHGFATQI